MSSPDPTYPGHDKRPSMAELLVDVGRSAIELAQAELHGMRAEFAEVRQTVLRAGIWWAATAALGAWAVVLLSVALIVTLERWTTWLGAVVIVGVLFAILTGITAYVARSGGRKPDSTEEAAAGALDQAERTTLFASTVRHPDAAGFAESHRLESAKDVGKADEEIERQREELRGAVDGLKDAAERGLDASRWVMPVVAGLAAFRLGRGISRRTRRRRSRRR